MKNFYWISFTQWNLYKLASTSKGYFLAKRIYYKARWTPFIKVKYCKYKNNYYGKER